jgi:hypothetical protein
MDLNKVPLIPQQQLPPSTKQPLDPHYVSTTVNGVPSISIIKKNVSLATTERIPTSTWGPFTIIVVVFLVILTCLILNCSRIVRRVNERRMDKLGRSGPFKKKSFERRHKELQEADLEWNNNPPMVYEDKMLATPESIHCSKHSTLTSSGWSSYSTLATAQNHHYNDINFIKNQPPGVQLRLTLENASTSSLIVEPNMAIIASTSSKSSKSSSIHRHMILPLRQSTNSIASSSHQHSTVTTNTKKISRPPQLPSSNNNNSSKLPSTASSSSSL